MVEADGEDAAGPDSLRVSVVIPSYNAAATLGAQLESLTAQTYGGQFEVVIADNGSSDATHDVVAAFADRLTLLIVDAADRRGAGHARNVGTAIAKGDLVAYCDADDVTDPGWLATLVRAIEGPAGADLVGGGLEHDLLNQSETEWRGRDGSRSLPRPLGFLPFAISANCATRREVWESIRGWGENFEHGGDDVDFCWRAQLAGYRLEFVPGAIVHYRRRSSLRGLAHQVFDYAQADVRLYKDYRHLGAPRRSARAVLRSFSYPVTRLPYLVMSRRRRGQWITVAVSTWGHVVGSWRNRVMYL